MVEETSLSVSRALLLATGLSGGQFGILSILVAAPQHSMRQQELANAMRWDRTRLSHVLTRMQGRGWIQRTQGGPGATLIVLAEDGKKKQQEAAPILAGLVRDHFFSRLTQAQLKSLEEIHSALRED